MNVFTRLEQAVTAQYEQGDLPQWLADPALEVAHAPAKYQDSEYLVELLIEQVEDFDVYAEAGCCKWAYDHEDIARTLKWLKEGK
jgi:hypothetical protein